MLVPKSCCNWVEAAFKKGHYIFFPCNMILIKSILLRNVKYLERVHLSKHFLERVTIKYWGGPWKRGDLIPKLGEQHPVPGFELPIRIQVLCQNATLLTLLFSWYYYTMAIFVVISLVLILFSHWPLNGISYVKSVIMTEVMGIYMSLNGDGVCESHI